MVDRGPTKKSRTARMRTLAPASAASRAPTGRCVGGAPPSGTPEAARKPKAPPKAKQEALLDAIQATKQMVQKARMLNGLVRMQRVSASLAKKARKAISKQNEVTADQLCHVFRDVLETRAVIPRGARAPNGAGPKRRYYRESCADPGSTALKRLRCQKHCCKAYDQHIRPKGVRPGDRAHCEGIDCKIKRRAPGSRGKALAAVAAASKKS